MRALDDIDYLLWVGLQNPCIPPWKPFIVYLARTNSSASNELKEGEELQKREQNYNQNMYNSKDLTMIMSSSLSRPRRLRRKAKKFQFQINSQLKSRHQQQSVKRREYYKIQSQQKCNNNNKNEIKFHKKYRKHKQITQKVQKQDEQCLQLLMKPENIELRNQRLRLRLQQHKQLLLPNKQQVSNHHIIQNESQLIQSPSIKIKVKRKPNEQQNNQKQLQQKEQNEKVDSDSNWGQQDLIDACWYGGSSQQQQQNQFINQLFRGMQQKQQKKIKQYKNNQQNQVSYGWSQSLCPARVNQEQSQYDIEQSVIKQAILDVLSMQHNDQFVLENQKQQNPGTSPSVKGRQENMRKQQGLWNNFIAYFAKTNRSKLDRIQSENQMQDSEAQQNQQGIKKQGQKLP